MTERATTELRPDPEALAHARSTAARSGSSFLWAMQIMPKPRREAMFAVYSFCREIDDIADAPGPPAEKLARLAEWRREIERLYDGRPQALTTRALLSPVREFDLQKQDFLALIEGMEMDACDRMRAPSMAELELYCDRVACAVGRLSIRAFGAGERRAQDVARSLGQALQLTNILRDLREDAGRGRLYLPRELLDSHGITERDPEAVLDHPALAGVCQDLADIARRRFGEAAAALADCAHRPMRPAVVMMSVYSRILDRLTHRGWSRLDLPVRVPKTQKIWIVLRHGLL